MSNDLPDFIKDSLEFKVDEWCTDTDTNMRGALHATLAFIEREGMRDKYLAYLERQKKTFKPSE